MVTGVQASMEVEQVEQDLEKEGAVEASTPTLEESAVVIVPTPTPITIYSAVVVLLRLHQSLFIEWW